MKSFAAPTIALAFAASCAAAVEQPSDLFGDIRAGAVAARSKSNAEPVFLLANAGPAARDVPKSVFLALSPEHQAAAARRDVHSGKDAIPNGAIPILLLQTPNTNPNHARDLSSETILESLSQDGLLARDHAQGGPIILAVPLTAATGGDPAPPAAAGPGEGASGKLHARDLADFDDAAWFESRNFDDADDEETVLARDAASGGHEVPIFFIPLGPGAATKLGSHAPQHAERSSPGFAHPLN
ncbi:hypothetical protein OC844_002229 [Tilletia horrida]|nr:hypothetical protein OC844_002229 [Tilletia horrida]